MTLIDRVKAGVVRLLDLRASPDPTSPRAESDGPLTDERALALSAVWACVNLIAGTAATLPLTLYRKVGDNGDRRVEDRHPLARVVGSNPNYEQTIVDFLEALFMATELGGNSYSRIIRIGGVVAGVVPIYDPVAVRRLSSGSLEYAWTTGGQSFREPETEVLHIRGFGGHPLGGLSTMTFARNTFGLARSIDVHTRNTFTNGLRPSGAFVFPGFLGEDRRTEIKKYLIPEYQTEAGAGRPLILEGGTDWKPFNITPEDAQMLESRRFSVEEIARIFGVPPHMIGHTDKATSWGTGVEQMTIGFVKFTLRRRLKRVEAAMTKQLLTAREIAGGLFLEFNIEGLLRGDSVARSRFYTAALQAGWMTINEVRALENMSPVDGGNVPRMQSQNVPITGAPPAPAVPALPQE